MGIKLLNRYLREKCTDKSINKQHLSHFAGKRIVIDTSIYLYHFLSECALMENMYLFISILKNYEIEPIFIFDGKTPQEKKVLVKERSQKKKEAEEKYNELVRLKKEGNMDELEDKAIQLELEALKRQFVRLRNEDIVKVKELMDAYGVIYYDAPYEADDLCVYFVKSGMAYACISDDMDMFLYGCPYVLRNFSLLNHSVLVYDTKSILDELNIPFNHFREILILSGTDYNINSETNLIETLKWYNQYTSYIKRNKEQNKPYYGFYLWLAKNTKYITDLKQLFKTYQVFNNEEIEHKNTCFDKEPKKEDKQRIKEIMQQEGFLFCND